MNVGSVLIVGIAVMAGVLLLYGYAIFAIDLITDRDSSDPAVGWAGDASGPSALDAPRPHLYDWAQDPGFAA